MQTLTTLNLWSNRIGDQGAKQLGISLQQNKVTFSFSPGITHSLFHTDTHYTESLRQ